MYGSNFWKRVKKGVIGPANGEDIDAQEGDVKNVGSLSTEKASITQADLNALYQRGDTTAVVWIDGSTYKAQNLETGDSFSGTDAATVLQPIINNVASTTPTTGGVIKITRGIYPITSTVKILNEAITLEGEGSGQAGKQFPTIIKDGGVSAGNALIQMGNANNAGHGATIKKMWFNCSGNGIIGLYGFSSDRLTVSEVRASNVSDSGNGILISGSYESNFYDVNVVNFKSMKNPTTNKNINDCYFRQIRFHTSGGVPPAILGPKNNFLHSFTINANPLPAGGGIPAIRGPTANGSGVNGWMLALGSIYGNGDPMVTSTNNCHIVMVDFANGENGLQTPGNTTISQCKFAGQSNNGIDNSKTGGHFKEVTITGCRFVNAGNHGIGIDASALNSFDYVTISANEFIDSTNKDIYNNAGGGVGDYITIIGNATPKGMTLPMANVHKQVLAVSNAGYNPIGLSRSTPTLPSTTGSSSYVTNANMEPAVVHLDGSQSGTTIINQQGTTQTYPDFVNTVELPPTGRIYFSSTVPSNWVWYWR